MRQLIRTYKITGDHQITISNYSFTKEDVRLIINESLASTDKLSSVLVSSTAKDNIISVNDGLITLSDKTASLKSTDILTIEIDVDNVAKESTIISQAQALSQQMLDNTEDLAKELTNQEILLEIGNIDEALDGLNGENLPFDFVSDYAKQGDNQDVTLTAIYKLLTGSNEPSVDIPEGVSERLALILEFFGIKPTETYEFMTAEEVCSTLEDIMTSMDLALTPQQAQAITQQTLTQQ